MQRVLAIFSASILFSLSFLALDLNTVSASGPEVLELEYVRYNDFHPAKITTPVLGISGDPGTSSATYWETNRTWLYWGNSTGTGDTVSDYGIGKGIYELSDPIGTSPYWTVSVTYWVVGIAFLSPTWAQIGTFAQSVSGVWSAANIGVGYTSTPLHSARIVHTQMHSAAEQDSWYWVNGAGLTDQPPTTWQRPTGGTNYYTFTLNTLENRPFSLAEVKNMLVILEVQFLTTIWAYLQNWQANSALSIGIGGLSVTVTPSTYTPPDTSNGFVLRPELAAVPYMQNTSQHWRTNTASYVPASLTSALNETTLNTATYIYANWTSINNPYSDSPYGSYILFNLTDCPDGADEVYEALVWMIAKSTDQNYNAQVRVSYYAYSYFETYPYRDEYANSDKDMTVLGISEGFANYSMEFVPDYDETPEFSPFTPFSSTLFRYAPFVADDLDSMMLMVQIIYPLNYTEADYEYYAAMGQLYIAQLAMLCVPIMSDWDDEYKSETVSANFGGIIWLIIIFLPAIALGQFVPKYGIYVGLGLMLGIFGATIGGFLPIALIGFAGIGVGLYKGG